MTELIIPGSKSSFKQRNLRAIITLPNDVFADNNNVIIIDNAKIIAQIMMAGAQSMPTAKIAIYGLNKAVMDKLTVYTWNVNKYTNARIELQSDGNVVFYGMFQDAYADYQNMPDVPFIISASYGILSNLKPVDSLSFSGAVKVKTIAQSIINLMEEKPNLLCNSDVDKELTDASFPGTPLAMLWKLQRDSRVNIVLEYGNVIVTNMGSWRENQDLGIPLVTSETGMIGSPVRKNQTLWQLRVLYHPSYVPLGLVRVQSKLIPNGGDFYAQIYSMSMSLESQTPNGKWFIDMQVWQVNYVQ